MAERLVLFVAGGSEGPRLGSEFHSAFWNIIPVTTPIELRRLLMLSRRKGKGGDKSKNTPELLGRGG